MNSVIRSVAFLIAAAASAGVALGAGAVDRSADILKVLQERFPGAQINAVSPFKPIPGLYEIVTPGELAYVDSTGNFLLAGKIMDTRTQENLTASRWSELHAIDFAALPLERALKTVRGNGSRKIAVFADPDCPYCKELEKSLAQVDNVTVYTFLFPLPIHPDARNKSSRIWCAPDRDGVWTRWMVDATPIPATTCAGDPVAQNLELGEKLLINSTPTLFLADGRRLDGAMSAADLEARLAAVKPK